jgi:predicted transcriptional regulator
MIGMATHKRKPKTVTVYVRLPETLKESLEEKAERDRRLFSVELQIAVEEYLERHGFWPPGAKRKAPDDEG